MATSFIRLPEVIARTGRSRATIYADIKKGRFPSAVPIGDRAVAWISDEIDQWIESKVSQARGVSDE